jgi:hypothetical protein
MNKLKYEDKLRKIKKQKYEIELLYNSKAEKDFLLIIQHTDGIDQQAAQLLLNIHTLLKHVSFKALNLINEIDTTQSIVRETLKSVTLQPSSGMPMLLTQIFQLSVLNDILTTSGLFSTYNTESYNSFFGCYWLTNLYF